jgi:hypothetical protein
MLRGAEFTEPHACNTAARVSKRIQSARVTKYCRIAQITPPTNNSASVLQGAKGHIDT